MKGSVKDFTRFKILSADGLEIRQWYRNSLGKPTVRTMNGHSAEFTEQTLILEVTDTRPFKIYEDEVKTRRSIEFPIRLELTDKTEKKKLPLTLQLVSKHTAPTIPLENSNMQQWYSK